MTREERREKLIKHLKYNRSIGADYMITDEDADEIIKALEQEPCDDAISRQAAIDGINEYFHDKYYQRTSIQDCRDCLIEDVIKPLLPVTPQPKIGHWIDKFGGVYRCSCCREIISIDTEIEFPNGIRYKYCPNCGAKMEGVIRNETDN